MSDSRHSETPTDARPARTTASAEPTLDGSLREAERVLADAGVATPRVDAELLVAHLMGVGRSEVRVAAVLGRPAPHGLSDLVAERARRVPLQHLTGRAPFRNLDLSVGPGVFVPRPETEAVAQVAIDEAERGVTIGETPVVVDLCAGSGAIALAVATEVPGVVVHAVELDPLAYAWAERNVADHAPTAVTLHLADARTALTNLDGEVDVVVSNPPYVPAGAVPIDPEVRDHDPELALYGGGADGLAVPRGVVLAAARLLRPGGLFVMEHAEVQAAAVRRIVTGTGAFVAVSTHTDLTGRDRMVVARRTGFDASASTSSVGPGHGPGPGCDEGANPGWAARRDRDVTDSPS